MKVTMYKCDICGKVGEAEPPYSLRLYYSDGGPIESPEVSIGYYEYNHDNACSKECVKKALGEWFDKKVEEKNTRAVITPVITNADDAVL